MKNYKRKAHASARSVTLLHKNFWVNRGTTRQIVCKNLHTHWVRCSNLV